MNKRIPIFSILFYIVAFVSLILIVFEINTPISSLIILIVFSVDLYLASYTLPKFNKISKQKIMHYTFIVLFIVYLIFLISLLFLNYYFSRDQVYETRINLIPFKTISLFILSVNQHSLPIISVVLNLIGNIIAFAPLAFYLPLFFKKMNKNFTFIVSIVLMITIVEVLQLIFKCGSCDVDDFILNLIGVLLFYFVLKIKKLKPIIERFTKF